MACVYTRYHHGVDVPVGFDGGSTRRRHQLASPTAIKSSSTNEVVIPKSLGLERALGRIAVEALEETQLPEEIFEVSQ